MPRRTPLRNMAEYLPARVLSSLIQCFPPRRNLETFGHLGNCYAGLVRRHLHRAENNLEACFPDIGSKAKRQIAKASIGHLFQVAAVDSVLMGRCIKPSTWTRHLDVEPARDVIPLLTSGEPLLMLTGHLGNWELLGYGLSVAGYPMHALARPLDNPYLNRWLLGIREAWGLKVLTKWGAAPRMQAILEGGGRLGFIADQNAGDHGLFVPFFGRLASAYKSIGLLAMQYEIPIVVAMARRRTLDLDYEIVLGDIIHPSDWKDQEDPLYYVTARYTQGLEQLVRQRPEQYLWIHRRWKSRPKHVREGKTMPRRLQDRIRSLPWLSPDESGAVIERSNEEATGNPTRL
ncbi:MAG: lysophospholipid acyltransferase family protein [Planctomycetes bacterium]|nr:lysophospholipid acyltransferase family protein [Planctomycetota bacterium]MCP4838993.1 lysophospholipid acyltransferase family protein [Planctomycetota bacterium]